MAQRDAFGRSPDESDPELARRSRTARAAPIPPADGGRERGPSAPQSGAPRPRATAAISLLATVALLAVGGVAIVATLRGAVHRAERDPGVVAFALQKDPLGDRSLLRPVPLRRALARLRAAADPSERLASLSIRPERALATLVDGQDQQRWLSVDPGGRVRSTDLHSTSSDAGAPLSALTSVDPTRAARYLARRYAQLQPHAREPTLVLLVSTTSSSSVTVSSAGEQAGVPQVRGGRLRYVYQWAISFQGVRRADASTTLDRDGRPVR